MKARTLLTLGLLGATPSLFAQTYPEPLEAVRAPAPKAPRAPRAALAPLPPIAATLEVPPLPPPPESPQTPKVAPAGAPAVPAPPPPMGQMINVRIEVTLSDGKGSLKTLVMTVADGEQAMNRSRSVGSDLTFNADARPMVVGNKIRLRISADALVPGASEKESKLGLSQSQTLILNDGDSVEIARATDPASERAFVLSVKVKIQR